MICKPSAAWLEGTGEFVDGQALSSEGTFVRYDGEGRPPVTDGPFAETPDLISGWMVIDVETPEPGRSSWRERECRRLRVRVRGHRYHELARDPDPFLGRAPDHRRVTHRGARPSYITSPPHVILGILVRRGADFAAAEDAVQDALVEAVHVRPEDPPRDPKPWLVTVAWRKFLDAARADTSRRHREVRVEGEPMPGPGRGGRRHAPAAYTLCAHPSLTPASAVALTLRAVGGLTTRQIAQAYLVPEATPWPNGSAGPSGPSWASGSTGPE